MTGDRSLSHRENTHNLIQEPQHPEGELSAVGHVPVIGKDVRILHTCNLRKVLAATANFEGVFAINLEVALGLTVFHIVRLGQAANGKGLAQSVTACLAPCDVQILVVIWLVSMHRTPEKSSDFHLIYQSV